MARARELGGVRPPAQRTASREIHADPRSLAARSAFVYFEDHETPLNFERDSLLI
jgi:hypothetical protein